MILIADGGSTKTSWCLIDDESKQTFFDTEGYNPYFVKSEYIVASIKASLPAAVEPLYVTEVNFYGAGCSDDKAKVIINAIETVFPNCSAYVRLDLLAAARALLGSSPGFAAILGTGTNTCVYDGKEISQRIDSLGFILGDEGSGGSIGKKLISDYIRGYMPENISRDFWNNYHLSADEIIDRVYSQPMANRFCAGFSAFVSERIHIEYFQNLVRSSFREFFINLVCGYPDYASYSFNCIGSLAFSFKDILAEVAGDFHMQVGRIIRSPINDLVKYHVDTSLPASMR